MNIKYRPDIDGLRSVAVLLVILYHLGASFIPGGFVGVDVFFVISGYLITSIVRKDILGDKFTYSNFYARRIKRLYPSLLSVLAATSIAAYFILLPDDILTYFKSAIASLLSVSNFFFLHSVGDYFSMNVEQTPLLHTWSLAVEEQYYIFAPLLITLIVKYSKGAMTAVFGVLTLILLLASIYATTHHPAEAYYMLPYRAFELMAGSTLATMFHGSLNINKRVPTILSISGVALIILSSLMLTKESQFPGLNAVWPCLGATFVIAASITASNSDLPIFNKILALPPLVYIGKISYPLYLWHWPLIAFVNYKAIPLNITTQSALLIATFILAAITYHLIENKVRYFSWRAIFSATTLIATPSILLFVALTILIKYDGFPQRFKGIEFARANIPDVSYKKCYNSFKSDADGYCILGDSSKKAEAIFIGDSMAASYIPFVDYLANDAKISIIATASSALPPVKNILPFDESNPAKGHRTTEKLIYNKLRLEHAKQYKTVIISASWSNGEDYFGAYGSSMADTIKELQNSGAKVIVIARPNGLTQAEFVKAKSERENGENLNEFKTKEVNKNIFLNETIKKVHDVTIINPNKVLCSVRKCKATLNGQIIYFEKDHLNISGSKFIARDYIEKFGNPLPSGT
jgi:peptidoglycan/LPS O-acetylase OafA/YrhL